MNQTVIKLSSLGPRQMKSAESYSNHLVCLSVHPSVCVCPCPCNNSQTLWDIFMKLCTNIKDHQMVCRKKRPLLHLHCLQNYSPLKIWLLEIMSAQYLWNPFRYFHETLYKYRAWSEDMQRTRTISLPAFFTELCPFENPEKGKN